MNKIEKLVYDLVKKNPRIKLFIRNVYQTVFDLLPRPKEYSVGSIEYRENFFFGFHDLQPFSDNNRQVLANKLYIDLKMPSEKDFIDVGYFTFDEGRLREFTKIGTSNAWNYHKGCRLQWLNNNSVIFNSSESGAINSTIINLVSQEKKVLSMPIDSVSKNGRFATSFSYERLEKFMPGYGYCHSDSYSFCGNKAPSQTGLFLIDIDRDESRLLVDLATLANQTIEEENSSSSSHYVTHSLFSHDGRYISFFHRWVGEDTFKRYTRLMIYDLHKGQLFQVPTGYMVSHYVWNENLQIIAYCNFEGKDAHALIDVQCLEDSKVVAYPQLNSDGHQSFVNRSSFVTDTYADKRRMSRLYYVDIEKNEAELLASLYSPNNYQTKVATKHIACDLHPRVSKDGRFVCFDTAKSGKRSLAVMALNKKV